MTGGVRDGVGTTVGGGITDIIDITSLYTIIVDTITATTMLRTITMRMQRLTMAEDIDKSICSKESQETTSPGIQQLFAWSCTLADAFARNYGAVWPFSAFWPR